MEPEANHLTPRTGADSGGGSLRTQVWMEVADAAHQGVAEGLPGRKQNLRDPWAPMPWGVIRGCPSEEGSQAESGLPPVTQMWRKHDLTLFHELAG